MYAIIIIAALMAIIVWQDVRMNLLKVRIGFYKTGLLRAIELIDREQALELLDDLETTIANLRG